LSWTATEVITTGNSGIGVDIKEVLDLIICDIMMPVLDGWRVVHCFPWLETNEIPFIF
jgi:CheY-like chemotaxis protein